ncbi:hypothetical protein DVH02_32090 [Streptomyces corynorhini]|uniref:Uncharacterized protein n=1 Tax=Streptomyces corynorhini TaxID=2282652 RepID=A0A370ATY9_9ACTN|nr:hypothetical protein DVH02_32090 [Streptomyces corynorhini]
MSSFSDVHLRIGRKPVLGGEKCYVLGKESARPGGANRVRSTGDHPRATTTGHAFAQPLDRPCQLRQEPPCPDRRQRHRTARWGPGSGRHGRLPCWYGIGPSVADRRAFTPMTQGGSLLASNGPITGNRPGGIGRPHRVSRTGATQAVIIAHSRTERGG